MILKRQFLIFMTFIVRSVKFSIIIPTYNSAEFIGECVCSVLSQSCQDFEIIIVDNYSTDDTIDEIRKYNQEKIKIFQNKNHGVIGVSRNFGVTKSSGKYIAFLDSDDFWYKNKLQLCSEYIPNNDMVCHLLERSNKNKNHWFSTKKLTFLRLMIGGNCVATSSVVMKKSVFEKYGGFSCDKELVTVEDYDFWLALLKGNSSVRLINQKLGFYRIHENNSSNVTQYSTAMKFLIEKWAQSVPNWVTFIRIILLKIELLKFRLRK